MSAFKNAVSMLDTFSMLWLSEKGFLMPQWLPTPPEDKNNNVFWETDLDVI